MNSAQFTAWCQASGAVIRSSMTYVRKPLIMGVLNVTPDSFSDAGLFLDENAACKRAEAMIEQGADIIDIGGESSRPGAVAVSSADELARVVPIIKHIRAISDICISIDTHKATVMEAAVHAGASLINDINALQSEGALATAAALRVPVCLMHMQGAPATMQNNPHYQNDVVDEINQFFYGRIHACEQAGILREHLILDPGFGFGKSILHNLQIIKRLAEYQQHALPVLLGVSRKSTLGSVLQTAVMDRMPGGLATAVFAALQGISIIRTHDVSETNQALKMIDAIVSAT